VRRGYIAFRHKLSAPDLKPLPLLIANKVRNVTPAGFLTAAEFSKIDWMPPSY